MAGRGAATFLKRQKEQKRLAKAQAKREAKRARRENRALGISDENLEPEDMGDEALGAEDSPETDESGPESEPESAPEGRAAD